jgi:hypothetical protein
LSGNADKRPPAEAQEPQLALTLEQLDRDGAIVEGIASVYGHSRADFLRAAVFGGTALVAGLSITPEADAASAKRDLAILNFGLAFEYLQSSFYVGAVREGTVAKMRPDKQRWA